MTPAEPGSGIPPTLDAALVALYRGWDALERANGRAPVIDFDLAKEAPASPLRDHDEVAGALDRLSARADALPPYWRDIVGRRLRASTCFLRASRGEAIPFAEYVEATMGIAPASFPEEEIRRRRDDVNRELQELGQRPDPNRGERPPAQRRRPDGVAFESRDFHRFQSLFMVWDPAMLPRHFEFYRDKWVPRLLQRVDVPMAGYDIRVEFASEDAYWKNWISGNLAGHQITLRINCHPRHSWYAGAAETLVLHEYCGHAIQMIKWHQRIERRELPDFAGILTVHFPDQFLLEGLAEVVAYVLPDDSVRLEPKSRVLRELNTYNLMVMNNLHILANEEGPETAFEYGCARLPFTKPEVIHKEIRDRVHHPLYRCYQYVYGIAKHTFLQAIDGRSAPESWPLLQAVYATPMMPAQFAEARTRL